MSDTHEDRLDSQADSTDDGRRASVVDRRGGLDRRLAQKGTRTGLEQRRGPGRRRTDFTRQAEEGEMSAEQFLFVMAIDAFKRVNGKTFPTWTEVLEVMRKLGYRKTMPSELNLPNTEDWTEPADNPSMCKAIGEPDADMIEDDAFGG